jgi:hypothetical protein
VHDAATGAFDEHGRLRERPPAWPVPAAGTVAVQHSAGASRRPSAGPGAPIDIGAFGRMRLTPAANPAYSWAAAELAMPRAVSVSPDTHTRIHRFKAGAARLLAFERNIAYHMSEDLKQAGGNEALEQPVDLVAQLDAPAHVYDLRTGRYLGRSDTLSFTLDPWQPALFALLPAKLPTDEVVPALLNGF